MTEWAWENGRGQQLRGYEFLPASSGGEQRNGASAAAKPWARLIWHHGVCEHAGRYTPVFQRLAEAGVAVYSFDAHGHGRSEPAARDERCWVRDWRHLVDDLYAFVAQVEQRVGGRLPAGSTFLGGQSMGGLVAALGALRCQERWAGLVVYSGAMGVVWTPVLRVQALLGNLLANVIPRWQLVPAVKPANLHPDAAVVAAFEADPLIFHGDLRVQTGNELLRAMHALEAARGELRLPLLVVHGTRDAVTSLDAADAFVRGVSSRDLTFTRVDGGFHEMLMGPERLASADGVAAWLRARAGAGAPHWSELAAAAAAAAGEAASAAAQQQQQQQQPASSKL